jgi:hypothetical protein
MCNYHKVDKRPFPKYNGYILQYDKNTDQTIINELGHSERLGYLELKKRIEKSLKRAISFDTYNVHLKRMLKENILSKQDNQERGKPVFYSLTEKAKKQIQLNLLGINSKQILFRRIYEKVFFYEVYHTPLNIVSSEQELDVFLSEINATRSDLRERYANSHELEFATRYKELSFADTQIFYAVDKCGVHITKTEYWEANKYSKNKYSTEYTFTLPGVSIKEFMDNDSLGTKFQRDDVKEGFSLLINNGLIEPALVFRGEIRYIITDERLRSLTQDLRRVHHIEWRLLMHKWQHFSEPTREEYQRMNWLVNEEEMRKIFRDAEMSRFKDKEVRRGKLIFAPNGLPKKPEEYLHYLNQELQEYESELTKEVQNVREKHRNTIEDYIFLHDIIGVVCPMVLR